MKKLLLITTLFLSLQSFSQHYSYTFSGELPLEKQQQLTDKLATNPVLKDIKLKVKSDSQRGILYFTYSPITTSKEQSDDPFFSQIKALFIEFGLNPESFNEQSK